VNPDPTSRVRPSAIAGQWYPGSVTTLRRDVDRYFEETAPVRLPGRIIGLVAPHAGYAYSGPTAAKAFAQVRGAAFKRVVLLGPLHRPIRRCLVSPFMVPSEDSYRTPLGDVPVDRAFIDELNHRVAVAPVQGDEEHSLEIELPFLQVALERFHLVPIMLGEHISQPNAVERATRLSEALAGLLDEETLLVSSTDLSHMENYADVIRIDRKLVDLLNAFDLDGLAAALQEQVVQACGATGLFVLLETCKRVGARGARVLQYTSSGDVTGDKRPGTYTVGYLAAVIHA
jgi:AmmeMemoRadiSam system protein B